MIEWAAWIAAWGLIGLAASAIAVGIWMDCKEQARFKRRLDEMVKQWALRDRKEGDR